LASRLVIEVKYEALEKILTVKPKEKLKIG